MASVVYAVCFSNYYPDEVESLWDTEASAQRRANYLGFPYEVVPMKVYTMLDPNDYSQANVGELTDG